MLIAPLIAPQGNLPVEGGRPCATAPSTPASFTPVLGLLPVPGIAGPAIDGKGFSILLSLVTPCLRHLRSPTTKVTALLLVSRLGAHVDDDTRLDRIVPYVASMLNDPSAMVRAHALAALTASLEGVVSLPNAESGLFSQWLQPLLQYLPNDPEPIVQMALGECFPRLFTAERCGLEAVTWRAQVNALQRALPGGGGGAAAAAAAAAPPSMPQQPQSQPSSAGTTGVAASAPVPVSATTTSSTALTTAGAAAPPARIRSTYDAELAALRRRLSSMLRAWDLNVTSRAPKSAEFLASERESFARKEETAFLRYFRLAGDAREKECMAEQRLRALLTVSAGSGSSSNSPGAAAAGRRWEEETDLIDGTVLTRLSHALRTLPTSIDATIMRRALLCSGGSGASLLSLFGREDMLAWLSTFQKDPTTTAALDTAATTTAGLLLRLPPGPSGDPTPSSAPIMTPRLMQLLNGWLRKGAVGTPMGDWEMATTFLRTMADLSPLLGPFHARGQLLVLFEDNLAAPCEQLVHAALCGLAALCRHALLPPLKLLALLEGRIAMLLLHPGGWVRRGAAEFVAALWAHLGWPGAYVDTAKALNGLLDAAVGPVMWETVSRELLTGGDGGGKRGDGGSSSEDKEEQLQLPCNIPLMRDALLASLIAPLPRALLDAKAHELTVEAMRTASPLLASWLDAASTAAAAVDANATAAAAASAAAGGGGIRMTRRRTK